MTSRCRHQWPDSFLPQSLISSSSSPSSSSSSLLFSPWTYISHLSRHHVIDVDMKDSALPSLSSPSPPSSPPPPPPPPPPHPLPSSSSSPCLLFSPWTYISHLSRHHVIDVDMKDSALPPVSHPPSPPSSPPLLLFSPWTYTSLTYHRIMSLIDTSRLPPSVISSLYVDRLVTNSNRTCRWFHQEC